MTLVVYLNSVNSTKFDQPMYTVIHMQDPGSVRVNQDHGSLASRVGHGSQASRVGSGLGSVSLTRFHLCSEALIMAITYGRSESTSSFNRKVGIGLIAHARISEISRIQDEL